MEAKTNLTIKLDQSVRAEFSSLCDEIGISMAGAITALIKQSIRTQSMSFSLRDENGFTYEEASELKRRIANLNTVVSHELIEVD